MLSCDLSDAALNRLKHRYPGAETMRLDLAELMPFGNGAFEAVMADLCLHYFPLQKTREIFAELHRVLSPGGWLFLRVNAREEYVPAPEDVRLETDYYVTRGCAAGIFRRRNWKRFFRASVSCGFKGTARENTARASICGWRRLSGRNERPAIGKIA